MYTAVQEVSIICKVWVIKVFAGGFSVWVPLTVCFFHIKSGFLVTTESVRQRMFPMLQKAFAQPASVNREGLSCTVAAGYSARVHDSSEQSGVGCVSWWGETNGACWACGVVLWLLSSRVCEVCPVGRAATWSPDDYAEGDKWSLFHCPFYISAIMNSWYHQSSRCRRTFCKVIMETVMFTDSITERFPTGA